MAHQETWVQEVPKLELLADFRMFLKGWHGSKATLNRMTGFLKRICPLGWPQIKRGRNSDRTMDGAYSMESRPWVYAFPSLVECRNYWDQAMGFNTAWQAIEEQPNDSAF